MNLTYTPSSLAKEDQWLCSVNHCCCVPLCWPECPWLHSFRAFPSPSAQMRSGATVCGAVSQLPCLGGWRRIHSRQLSVSQAGSPVGRSWVPPLALAANCFLYLWPVLALLWKKSALPAFLLAWESLGYTASKCPWQPIWSEVARRHSPQQVEVWLSSLPAKLLRSCLTLCDPIDCSLPGSSGCGASLDRNTGVGCHALLQGPSWPGDQTYVS